MTFIFMPPYDSLVTCEQEEDKIMKDDKTIARIRAVRRQISAKFGHDVDRLGKYYMNRQSKRKHKSFSGSHATVSINHER